MTDTITLDRINEGFAEIAPWSDDTVNTMK